MTGYSAAYVVQGAGSRRQFFIRQDKPGGGWRFWNKKRGVWLERGDEFTGARVSKFGTKEAAEEEAARINRIIGKTPAPPSTKGLESMFRF